MALKYFSSLLLCFASVSVFSQTSLDLFGLRTDSPSRIHLKTVDSTNVVVGYPSFHPTEPLLAYVVKVGQSFEAKTYNLVDGTTQTVFRSEKKLRDPQFIHDTNFLSCLRENGKGSYELLKIELKGDAPTLINSSLSFSAYVWIDDNSLLAVVDGNPNTLQLVTLRPFRAMVVAQNVSEVVQRNQDHFAFLHKLSVASWSIKRVDRSGKIEIIASAIPDSDAFCFGPEDRVLQVDGDNRLTLLQKSGAPKPLSVSGWPSHKKILSIGVSPDGATLFVVSENF